MSCSGTMEGMDTELIQFLIANGYWIMFILMWLEGPVVTLGAAFLASQGYFEWHFVLLISLLGDITGDIVLYFAGRRWGMAFVKGPGRYIGLQPELVNRMTGYFDRYGGRTIFLVKSTTGLCFITFVAAGMARMELRKFLTYSLMGGIIWSGTLVLVGYFFGYLYSEIAQAITWAGWVIFGAAALFYLGVQYYKRKRSSQLFIDEEHLDEE